MSRMANVTVVLTVQGNGLSQPGTQGYDRMRQALWDALDATEFYVEGNDGDEAGPYSIVVSSVEPLGQRAKR